MTDPRLPSALRTARTAKGWSQSGAARELAALARALHTSVAGAGSLKTQLSRWENGHAVPEPHYRDLLAQLYDRTPAELGLEPPPSATSADGLRGSLAAAAAVDAGVLALWREQLTITHRLDGELGASGSAGPLRALVDQLDRTLRYCVTAEQRRPVAAVLAEAAVLAGDLALDSGDPDTAWVTLRTAHAAAVEAGAERTRADAAAALADVLVETGAAHAALALLADEPRSSGGPAARVAAARGLAAAATGDRQGVERSFAAARSAAGTLDVIHPSSTVTVAALDGWWGHALVTLGHDDAEAPLRRALDAGPGVRDRATLLADLALTLAGSAPDRSAECARAATDLAARIGSERVAARLRTRTPA